ncbi:MAG: peptide chain release factor 1 [Dehalococcoidia bacterium]|nr:peptide chain release factor 1 [Dehalococcoidia bacterium]
MLEKSFVDRLKITEKRYDELADAMSQSDVVSNPEKLQEMGRERAGLEDVVLNFREFQVVSRSLEETRALMDNKLDEGMSRLVKEEIESLKARQEKLSKKLDEALQPKDPNDQKNVIVEIRAGTGGQEAGLFGGDLFRMYTRYAQAQGWQVDVIDSAEGERGGYKEVIFAVKGKGAFSRLKYERGVHRVQRVPMTEASGRIHTSTATVAVLPEAEEVDLSIKPEDIRMEYYHSSGAGGQNVNKVETAVRIYHIPTGLVASCQDERSQLKNKAKAMAVLRARVFDRQQRERQEQLSEERRSQVGTGERSEKIRTYNFPQDRVTDHRIGLSKHGLPRVLDGEMDDIIDALAVDERAKNSHKAYQGVGS